MKNMGDTMTDEELDEMVDAADTNHDGLINYKGTFKKITNYGLPCLIIMSPFVMTEFVMILSKDTTKQKPSSKSKKNADKKRPQQKSSKDAGKSVSMNANIQSSPTSNLKIVRIYHAYSISGATEMGRHNFWKWFDNTNRKWVDSSNRKWFDKKCIFVSKQEMVRHFFLLTGNGSTLFFCSRATWYCTTYLGHAGPKCHGARKLGVL
jgi:hypothetical protein